MAEGTYDYECMRAELLGLEKPDLETFEAKKKEQLQAASSDIEGDELQELESRDGQLNDASGGLDELNSILSITQQKINKFKTACGSLTNLLKIKVGHRDSSESLSSEENGTNNEIKIQAASINDGLDDLETMSDLEKTPIISKKSAVDIGQKMSSQIDKLDSMLTKADNAQYSMAHQNKIMKSALK